MIEQDDYEITAFVVTTPDRSSSSLSYEEKEEVIDRIFKELGTLGVTEVGHYCSLVVTVDRNYDMTLEEQYCLVVQGLEKILNDCLQSMGLEL